MLQIRQIKHLARQLSAPPQRLVEIAESTDNFCEELTLLDPAKPDKPRDVLNVTGALRAIQARLLRHVLLPKLTPSDFSHGGIRGRNIKSNVEPHMGSSFVFTTDVSDFYPSVSRNRVYNLFTAEFGCSPDVARICTKLCTFRHHLALGLATSPILADQVLLNVDARIAGACRLARLVYTRFVDDITISGGFDLQQSGFADLVQAILEDHGFLLNPNKHRFGRVSQHTPITKITIANGHPDVRREYLRELERQLEDAASLASGRNFEGPYYTAGQIGGRVQFVCWVNSHRRRRLRGWYRSIPWKKVEEEARNRGLVVTKKVLIRQDRGSSPAAT